MTRLAPTSEAARQLGFVDKQGEPKPSTFLSWAKQQKGFPRPKRKHHLWWDMKAIHQYLDRESEIKTESVDHTATVRERLAKYGNAQSEIRR